MNDSASLDKAYATLIATGKPAAPTKAGRKPKVEVMASSLSELAKQINPGSEPNMSGEADELLLFLDNDEYTYRQVTSIIENLRKKITKGRYNHALAPKLWTYAANTGSQRYLDMARKHQSHAGLGRDGIPHAKRGTGSQAFSAEVRREVGKYMAWRFIKQAQGGEHDK
jgi:hypothetical protein